MEKIGEFARLQIQLRVGSKGTDIYGAQMRYSRSYARQRAKGGGGKPSRQTGYKDFFVTGRFWRDFRIIKVSKRTAWIGFTTGYGKTIAEAAWSRGDRWMGLTKGQKVELCDHIEAVVERNLRDLVFIKRR